jgi:predicted site-specific integrase-resolvase
VSEHIGTVRAMPDETYLMKPSEVLDLLRIGRTTLHEWRTRGDLEAIRHHAKGPWYYPATQPVIRAALDAVRAAR